jgi:2-polyprenyl-6-methoxyphenol hydroxylase-like FAD-dependent oxidoreductase
MDVLISGAGVAGLSVALNLGAGGHRITIVERASHLRVTGSPIDVRGHAIEIVKKMGLLDLVLARRLVMSRQSAFVDASGAVLARLPVSEISDSDDDIEIAREDMAHILGGALRPDTTLRFSDSISSLLDNGDGVDVEFESGASQRFDLVIGADGLHSAVRRLTFGPESNYARHLGYYAAITELPADSIAGNVNPTYNYPGHMVSIMRYKHRVLGVFLFRSDPIDYDYHDLDAQKEILANAFAGHTEWKIPELLEAAGEDSTLYFDSASQIHMATWHRQCVVLVGDAAHAASGLSGRGTSLALTGAYFLAEELDRRGSELAAAFDAYEARQRPYVKAAQDSVHVGADLIVPATWTEIQARNERIRSTGAHCRR